MSARTEPQPGIPARYLTDCPRCPWPINIGDRISFVRGVPVHCACRGGADDE